MKLMNFTPQDSRNFTPNKTLKVLFTNPDQRFVIQFTKANNYDGHTCLTKLIN